MLTGLRRDLGKKATKARAEGAQRYFKTGPGEYGEGDRFIGVTVPDIRNLAEKYIELEAKDLTKLITSPIHEERLLALLVLVQRVRKADRREKKKCFLFYVRHMKNVNNWDLVDLSAHHIVGGYLQGEEKKRLDAWAQSKNLWTRRISILATFAWIQKGRFVEALRIARMLLTDEEDLIHKAVGWMLREIGKRDLAAEESFLKKHYHKMPRTMLRYAIERFEEKRRKAYLDGRI